MPVQFGDCADVTTVFTSGTRPQASAPTPGASARYEPGQANPLQSQREALAACFRLATPRYGITVIDFTYDATGKVIAATEQGLPDPTHACVLALAARVTRVGAPVPSERCSIAFGSMPASKLPALDLAPSGTRFRGTVVEDSVAGALGAAVAPMLRPVAGEPLALVGPIAIRPTPDAPMGAVDRAVAELQTVNAPFVLTTAAGADWQLVEAIQIPVAPVPIGTGGGWPHYTPGSAARPVAPAPQAPTLSILVDVDRIVLRDSSVPEPQTFPAGPEQPRHLAAALVATKASSAFLGRTDLEVAGAARVPYQAVIAVIYAAKQAGFTGWWLGRPPAPAVPPTP